jgi:hypothetical protein
MYNNVSQQYLTRVKDLNNDLKEAEDKYNFAVATFEPDTVIYEFGLDLQNIKKKLKYFSERMFQMKGEAIQHS